MLREDIKGLQKATPRDFRKFGLTVGSVFLGLGLLFCLRHKPYYWSMLAPGVPLVVLGAVLPCSLKWIYVLWMTFAIVLGAIVSTILLTLVFYLVVTPIALLARLAGKDFLARRGDPEARSYWILRDRARPEKRQRHEQQF